MKLVNGRVIVRLHELRPGEAMPLLLLHELGGAAADWREADWSGWDGPVYALDFAGHGASGHTRGAGYYPELFLADADLALEALDDCAAVAGAGIGAYIALLLAGSRPDRVPGALLLPGRGLEGGGAEPSFAEEVRDGLARWEAQREVAAGTYDAGTDPGVCRCEQDIRPIDYVRDFAGAAKKLLFSDEVTEAAAPAWWRVARTESAGTSVSGGCAAAVKRLCADVC